MSPSLTLPTNLNYLPALYPDWQVLVLASNGAAIAKTIADGVQQVTLLDLLGTAERSLEDGSLSYEDNIEPSDHDVNHLPYADDHFDLIIVYHLSHLLEIATWLREAGRILKADGNLALTTYLIPGSRLRGKKARLLRAAGCYINSWAGLCDPQHRHYYSQSSLEDLLFTNSFAIESVQTDEGLHDFEGWIAECSPSPEDRLRLKAMLIQAPKKAHEFLTPQFSGDKIRFRLPEISILATSKANKD